jgi:hypothetical protein
MGTGFHGGFGKTQGSKDQHDSYQRETLPKRSPITISPSATIKEETKAGYQQVKYSWKQN